MALEAGLGLPGSAAQIARKSVRLGGAPPLEALCTCVRDVCTELSRERRGTVGYPVGPCAQAARRLA